MINWKPVKGWERYYEVSSNGDVRKKDGELIGQWNNGAGYRLVKLAKPRAELRVHRIVAEAFIDNPCCHPIVNHIDFNRANNNVSNLEWCDQKHNLNHSTIHGRMPRDYNKGKRSANASLDECVVDKIRRDYANGGISLMGIANKYNTNKRTVGRIVNRQSYV